LPLYSRPETAFDLWLAFENLGSQFKKIHLAQENVALPKFLDLESSPARSMAADTLHLSVTVHGAQADQDWEHVLADLVSGTPRGARQGGPLRPCARCSAREQKRQSRKQLHNVNVEKTRVWLGHMERGGHMVGIDWNEYEDVRHGGLDASAPWDRFRSERNAAPLAEGEEVEMALDLRCPGAQLFYMTTKMRIVCKCNQLDTKWFRAAFTLKDSRGHCVAQGISTAIVVREPPKKRAPGAVVQF
jgi:hypothetical protein